MEKLPEMKDIPGHEGRYAVTRDGRVWSYPKGGSITFHAGKFLSLHENPNSGVVFATVSLGTKGRTTSVIVAHAVATAFVPNPQNLPVIKHYAEPRKLNSLAGV